jgi:hypothetical protein
MTVRFPDGKKGKEDIAVRTGGSEEKDGKVTFGVGARIDVEKGRRHEVWMGEEGCEYVIGE